MTIWDKIKQKLGKLKVEPTGTASTKQQTTLSATDSEKRLTTPLMDTQTESHNKYSQTKLTYAQTQSNYPVTERIIEYLTHKGWKFSHFPPKDSAKNPVHHLSLGMQSDDMEWGCLFRINEDNKLLSVYGILPFSLSQEQISAGVALATQVNYDLMIGNVEVDLRDGEVRFKNAIDTECTELEDSVLDYLTQSVTAMTHVIYQLFYEIYQGKGNQPSLDELLEHLQEQTTANAYFVPTESIQ